MLGKGVGCGVRPPDKKRNGMGGGELDVCLGEKRRIQLEVRPVW